MLRPVDTLRALWNGFGRYSPQTYYRLMFSAHVRDLRWLAGVSFCLAFVAIAVIFLLAGFNITSVPHAAAGKGGVEPANRLLDHLLVPFQVSAVVGGLGAILTWCFQTGNVRLGTVDLFACEIATVCRIWIVDSVVLRCIEAYELDIDKEGPLDLTTIAKQRERFAHFDSSEKYTPIFDGNAKELRNLSVKVLTNMTAFYTYGKAISDAYRKLASVKETATGPQKRNEIDAWHGAMRHLIFMQFLTCESARKAVRDLIEFQPSNAENAITILLSELPAYGFLLKNFPPLDPQGTEDLRHERLELRRARYKEVVRKLYEDVHVQHKQYQDSETAARNFPFLEHEEREGLCRDWARAHGMLSELARRFKMAMDEPILADHQNGQATLRSSLRE